MVKRKLKKKSGFTLAETLLAVIILLLVSLILANGISVMKNVYENLIIGSNAQVLLSTTVESFRNELGTAWDVQAPDGEKSVFYYSGDTNLWTKLVLDSNGKIKKEEYTGYNGLDDDDRNKKSDYYLIPKAAYMTFGSKDMQISYDSIDVSPDPKDGRAKIVTLKNLDVLYDGNEIASLGDTVNIRVLTGEFNNVTDSTD